MNDEKLRCAEAALHTVPREYVTVTPYVIAAVDNGHSYHKGMHVGWAWGRDRDGGHLDFLAEHRMTGMTAHRFHENETTERLDVPTSFRQVDDDPAKDAENERLFIERNQRAYAALRVHGLLPPEGRNIGSQDLNEFLLTTAQTSR